MSRRRIPKAVPSIVVCLAFVTAICHANPDEGLLQKLFRLFRPAGTYEGRLSDAVTNSTKSADASLLPRVYIINVETGENVEWALGRGAVDPVVCPGGLSLFIRRGTHLEEGAIDFSANKLDSSSRPTRIESVEVQQLLGCTQSEVAVEGQFLLWIKTKSNEIATLKVAQGTTSMARIPEGIIEHKTSDIVVALVKLRGVRGDGSRADVIDGKLRVSMPSGEAKLYEIAGTPLAENPTWVGDTNYVVAIGLRD